MWNAGIKLLAVTLSVFLLSTQVVTAFDKEKLRVSSYWFNKCGGVEGRDFAHCQAFVSGARATLDVLKELEKNLKDKGLIATKPSISISSEYEKKLVGCGSFKIQDEQLGGIWWLFLRDNKDDKNIMALKPEETLSLAAKRYFPC